jgi:ATP-dependent exoDNAse (exonuclease V) alpha subunit
VVIVDEAGMVGSRHLHRLLQATTATGARLVLVGDHCQLAEIDAGGLVAALARRLGCAQLTENRRQCDPAQRAVVRALRDQDPEPARLRLSRMGRVTTLDNAEHVRDRMADDWVLEHRDSKQAVMLALHRSDVADLNRRARAGSGLSVPWASQSCASTKSTSLGDRVMALRNNRRIGLLNGTRATVQGRAGNDLVVATDEGRRVQVPLSTCSTATSPHAYALTVHKSQGMTATSPWCWATTRCTPRRATRP